MKTQLHWLILLGVLLANAPSVLAQNFTVDWFTVDGGGGRSSGGGFTLSGTIGQPEVGTMSNGRFSLTGGFWSLFAVQAAGAPQLSITITATNTALIFWPATANGFGLQSTTQLDSTNWINVATVPANDGTNKFVVVAPPVGERYYRLSQP
jgi:hypothetical protein